MLPSIFINSFEHLIRARKLYTSARIYEWKFGKGEWKLPFASPTGQVDFFGFVIIFDGKKGLTSMFYSLQKQRKHSEERSFGRFKVTKCDRMFTLVSSKCNQLENQFGLRVLKSIMPMKPTFRILSLVYENGGQSDYHRIPQDPLILAFSMEFIILLHGIGII